MKICESHIYNEHSPKEYQKLFPREKNPIDCVYIFISLRLLIILKFKNFSAIIQGDPY